MRAAVREERRRKGCVRGARVSVSLCNFALSFRSKLSLLLSPPWIQYTIILSFSLFRSSRFRYRRASSRFLFSLLALIVLYLSQDSSVSSSRLGFSIGSIVSVSSSSLPEVPRTQAHVASQSCTSSRTTASIGGTDIGTGNSKDFVSCSIRCQL